ncbi:General L-amino acid-binding periplasmic protein AapJ [Candidatus Terasakiella magnetica]|uniref:General L-amino acid-binding periplasmic protein AapJ n=1 Tax=Candidatus Terasakiella magnetica TaxID=1867952 RepID=A0A1C3RHL7_9PROT|nr:amino acid ABC transporter substrate-binding protein [Candidatus Terasakiella magnetica]SCA56761.1 General L-amino acid-binding periplasmic protein AapJ [Candidatus Terasakiella magnetica]
MRFLLLVISLFLTGALVQVQASTLDDIRERGHVTCGVDEQHFGFAYLNEMGKWQGFEVDYCRALAVAVFNDPLKAQFIPLNAQTRFTALQQKQIDVLLRSTTWTFTRDSSLGLDYPGVTFYDQLGMLVHKSIGVDRLDAVKKGTVCVAAGTTTLETVREYVEKTKKDVKIKMFNSREGLNNFFFSGQCDLYAADQSALTAIVSISAPNPQDYKFLKTTLSKEPLGPVVRDDDGEWYDIVKWLVYGLIEAEERGITQANVDDMKQTNSRVVRFMLGQNSGLGKPLRLEEEWLANVIRVLGNYGEFFERNLGQASALKMERGLNALWHEGGLMYAMPIR